MSKERTRGVNSLFNKKHQFNKLFIHTWVIISIILMVFGRSLSVYAQDTGLDDLDSQSLESSSRSFTDYLPYLQYNSYQYDGQNNRSMYILLEYGLNEQNIYQVSILFEDGYNETKLYQVKQDGLYEIAHYDNVGQVADLRRGVTTSGQASLVFASDLSKGQSFKSGYNGEYVRTVKAILPVWVKGKLKFEDVVAIEESGYENGQSVWYYYAPYFGLICQEVRDSQGQIISALHLDRIYNTTE